MKKRSNYTLSKADLVVAVYNKMGYSKKHTEKIVTTFFNLIQHSLEKKTEVKISKFGKFFVRNKKARKGRNPKTGEPAIISARKVIVFHVSSHLKKLLQTKNKA